MLVLDILNQTLIFAQQELAQLQLVHWIEVANVCPPLNQNHKLNRLASRVGNLLAVQIMDKALMKGSLPNFFVSGFIKIGWNIIPASLGRLLTMLTNTKSKNFRDTGAATASTNESPLWRAAATAPEVAPPEEANAPSCAPSTTVATETSGHGTLSLAMVSVQSYTPLQEQA